MQIMGPLDASFLHIEDSVTHMHIGSLVLMEGPAPSQDEILAMVASKLGRIPRYRQKVRFLPLSLGRPAWVDDPYFNIGYHVRRTALPEPGGDAEIRTLMGRVMSQKLDRSKPLWEMWIVEGLDHGRWALINKIHHCMVDGVSGTNLVDQLFDPERGAPAPMAVQWRPEREPGDAELVLSALYGRATSPYEAARTLWAAARGPRRTLRQIVELGRAVGSLRPLLNSSAVTLNGPIGPHRRWTWTSAPLADVKTIRSCHGGTVNDVVLTVVAQGFRDLLLSRGEPVDGVIVRTLVPVSVRSAGDSSYDNKVSAMFADLPVGMEDPRECLAAIRAQMAGLKERKQALAAAALTSMSGFAPPMLLGLAGRVTSRTPQRSVNTAVTNVPGPQRPTFMLGRRMLAYIPFVPLATTIRITVVIVSYDGNLAFGITGDWDGAPDIQVLCDGIDRGLAALLGAEVQAPPTEVPSTSVPRTPTRAIDASAPSGARLAGR